LTLLLRQMGADVTGFALPATTSPSLFEIARVGEGITSILGDIRDLALVERVVKDAAPEIILHLAAQSLVRYSYKHPVETYQTNVMGTVHLLEAIRQTPGIRAVVNVTSDKCYDNREWVWGYRERDPMGGHDPYSNSKGCVELVTEAFRASYFPVALYEAHGVAIASARAGNVIGGGDWAEDRLVPDILRAIVAGETVNIRSPHAIRPWQHVLEPLAGYVLLAEKLYEDGISFAEAWNFGPDDKDTRSVSWITNFLTKGWSQSAQWTVDSAPQPHEAHYLKLDSSKARQCLGWQPRWSLEEALKRILAWQQAFLAGADMKSYTLDDIEDYTRKMKG
jgi:CDP-glucose 4,6-dehydratase